MQNAILDIRMLREQVRGPSQERRRRISTWMNIYSDCESLL